ncbi:putative F-box protein At5g50220 [Silene latifolia]|uniref:putative F-box protein At5g50220 n=1 Tax=Silene latifolia TaxID=37657 RepID=UPI003D7712F5
MKSRKMKTSNNQYIPFEVLTQILAYLPAKSVLKFRCVCKSWCSIIDSPDFVSMHLQLCNTNPFNSGKVLALEGLGRGGCNGSLLTLRKADTLRKTDHIFKCSQRYYLYGSCNSLLLMGRVTHYQTCPRLCNPSVGKSLLLPLWPLPPYFKYNTSFVLGFALHTKDFKVIVIAFNHATNIATLEMRVAVYTLSDQQWAVRDNGLNIDGLSFKNLIGPYYFCEGSANWLGNQVGKPTHLVSLDFDTESFSFLELPYALDEVNTTSRSLFLLGESLAFFCISSVSLKIWVLKQESVKSKWTLWFSGPSSSDGFNLFHHRRSKTRILYYKGDGGSLVYGKKSYNIATCQVRSIGKSLSRNVELGTYYESLVLCKGCEAQDMASFPFCLDKEHI